ncbi:MAG: ATP-dependent Clp protease ATP-binding subunit, partial [Anaerolineae bacterium]|nr:ATP-dependent Clp protease ATP-binding subunit [Anaerolineae bacterium]
DVYKRQNPGRDADFTFVDETGATVRMSTEMVVVLDEGRAIAQAADELRIGTEHALAALAERGVSTAALLRRYGISPETMTNRLVQQAQTKRVASQDLVALARAGEARPVYVRGDLMRDLLGLLTLANHRHVVLVGENGVGKRSLVHGLALLIAEGKGPVGLAGVVQVSENALLADAEQAIETARRQAAGGILFIPNVDRFFGSALSAPEFPKGTRSVQRAFLDQQPVVIATATDAAWKERLQADSIIASYSHTLRVGEPAAEESVAILQVHRPALEHDYGLRIAEAALPAAVNMAKRYVAGLPLPASALAALHRACAMLKLAGQSQAAFRPDLKPDAVLDEDDVAAAVSAMTGIPVNKLGADERTRYAGMVEALHQRIIGQDEAVLAVSRAVKIARVGLKDPKRPIGSFLFLGPSGVGKTELARALAEFLYGSEEAMIALDMSEYQQDHTVNRLIGAPPGYVGYEGGGQLTEKVRQRPSAVVLFDEVEKAHPRVLDVLLQIMEEGRLTDAQGRTTSFSETVIILTSNLGSSYLDKPVLTDEMRETVMATVRAFFRPEFLNRLDDIILFLPLTSEQLRQILELMLKKESKMLAAQGVQLTISAAAKEWLLAQNDHPEWGARPLRRIIQRHLREPLADWLLTAAPARGAAVAVDVDAAGLVFRYA